MGEVLMQPMGGGIGSDDVTAAKAHVLAGHNTVTTDSDDEVVEGTMPDRGQWQYGKSMAHVNGYYAMNQLPEGYYHADGAAWAPEVRMEDAVAKQTSMWSDAYSAGVSDADSRVNTNSASYNSGKNDGKNDVKNTETITLYLLAAKNGHSESPSSTGLNEGIRITLSRNRVTGTHQWYNATATVQCPQEAMFRAMLWLESWN